LNPAEFDNRSPIQRVAYSRHLPPILNGDLEFLSAILAKNSSYSALTALDRHFRGQYLSRPLLPVPNRRQGRFVVLGFAGGVNRQAKR
jgi:hypothetical protein